MADIAMCSIEYCKMIPFCQRHKTNTEPNKYAQSYLAEPEKDCKDKNYELYIGVNSKMNNNELDARVRELQENPSEIMELLQNYEHLFHENEQLKVTVKRYKGEVEELGKRLDKYE